MAWFDQVNNLGNTAIQAAAFNPNGDGFTSLPAGSANQMGLSMYQSPYNRPDAIQRLASLAPQPPSNAGSPGASNQGGQTPTQQISNTLPAPDLAAYQAQAQKLFGQNPLFGNTPFVQNHPVAANAISNVFLALQKSQPGMTPADSARIVANMGLAPQEYARQQGLNEFNYVNQRALQQTELNSKLAEINLHNQQASYYSGARTSLAEAQADAARARAEGKTHFGTPVEQPDGTWIQPEFDSTSGKVLNMVPLPGAPRQTGNPNVDYTLSGIQRRLDSPDPAVRTQAQTDLARYQGTQINIAGGKTGAEQGAPHAEQDKENFINRQSQGLYNDISAEEKQIPKTFEDYHTERILQGNAKSMQDSAKDYENLKATTAAKYNERRRQFSAYQASDDPANRIPFDPNKDYTQPQSKNKAAPSASSNSGSKWNPAP